MDEALRPVPAAPHLSLTPCQASAARSRPEGLAAGHAGCFGNRPGPVRLGTSRPRRPGSCGPCAGEAEIWLVKAEAEILGQAIRPARAAPATSTPAVPDAARRRRQHARKPLRIYTKPSNGHEPHATRRHPQRSQTAWRNVRPKREYRPHRNVKTSWWSLGDSNP